MPDKTHYCGQLCQQQVGETVQLQGWAQRRRDLGGVIFVDLRDASGIVQIVFHPELSRDAMQTAENIRSEFVLDVRGKVVKRDEDSVNPKIATGDIEVKVTEVAIINAAKTPPFDIADGIDVAEDIRLKYRYLDLRRPVMQKTFRLRHRINRLIRDFLDDEAFVEIETPTLTKSTPEGARDYLVPSRVHPGTFYALPQSPQLFKQLLMVSGFERYYQVVRCFRDEDLRADRQPEFTQIDVEVSFMEQAAFLDMIERMMKQVVYKVKDVEYSAPFPRMTYREAMARYGSDKPDTRFGMELVNVSDIVKDSQFKVFNNTVENGGEVKAVNVKDAAEQYSRKDIDALAEFTARYGAKGLAWMKVEADGLKGPIAKFFNDEESESLQQAMIAEAGDLLLFVADKKDVVADSLGALRLKLGKDLGLIDENKFNFLWITDFPLFSYDEDAGAYTSEHHPFTMPREEDLPLLDDDPTQVRAMSYDLVLNGYELSSGSQRIHDGQIQERIFQILGFSKAEAHQRFGFLLEAFSYGAPPHGGIAIGFDRLVMILAGHNNLRDVVAFPKTASASDLMTDAPSEVSQAQLDELYLDVKEE